jgi:hypothetical protein
VHGVPSKAPRTPCKQFGAGTGHRAGAGSVRKIMASNRVAVYLS